jgi:hypothetical protein
MAEVTKGDMYAAVAEEGGSEGVRILGDLMAYNEREQEWLASTIQAGLEADRDRWQERALAAEERLHRIENRLFSLLS